MAIGKALKNLWNYLFSSDDENQVTPADPQEDKAATKKIYTYKDIEFIHDNYSGMTYANMDFNNGYHMYISVEDYSDDLENHESPAGYEITIFDSKGRRNSTCLNKDGKDLVAYNKSAVTTLMKQIQQLDEKGHISATHDATRIQARKQYLLKKQKDRKAYKKSHPEDDVSGVILADEIAKSIISGSEKRKITPAVAREYKAKLSRHQ